MEFTSFKCDECGKVKGEANHAGGGNAVFVDRELGIARILLGPERRGLVATVDMADLELVIGHGRKWRAHPVGNVTYARYLRPLGERPRAVYMHRIIRPDLALIDHEDGDGLNNRRRNLLASDKSKNGLNRHRALPKSKTGLSGVTVGRKNSKLRYIARLYVKGKVVRIGRYATPEEAHEAWRQSVRNIA